MEQLGINWGLLIAQLFNVALVVWIVSQLLFKPVVNMLNERTKRIEEGLKGSDRMKEEMAKAKAEYDAEIAKARQEAAAIVAQAQDRAKNQEAEIVAQARQEADRIRRDAQAQAEQERQRALQDMKGQMAELVTLTAQKVLGAELKGNHDRLIEESLANLATKN